MVYHLPFLECDIAVSVVKITSNEISAGYMHYNSDWDRKSIEKDGF